MLPHAHQSIGLLGGSFNPAHEGHVHLSLEAIKRLRLDAVWWLVSPQNPLKKKSELADYETRLASAKEITAPHRNIIVSDIEQRQNLRYSIDTIAALQQQYSHTNFVWLMGADNLNLFHKWREWNAFFARIPIAVFDRAPYSHGSLRNVAATRYQRWRFDESDSALLARARPPAWVYCHMSRHATSSTHLRKTLGNRAFFRHNKEVEKK